MALISLGFGRGAQVGKSSFLEVNLYGASVDVGCIHFLFVTLQSADPGIPPKPSIFGRNRCIFLTMQSQDSETITFHAAVRCCVTFMKQSPVFSHSQHMTVKVWDAIAHNHSHYHLS